MNETKVLTIIGANSSGKTTLAFKIAKELENNGNQVCIVSFDTISPLATIKNNYENYDVSIGYILTKDTSMTQRDVYTSMIPLTDNISLISYIYGDIKDKYPKLLSNKIMDFIDLLKGIVDYIVIDAGSNIIKVENRTSCQISDRVLNILEPNYKSIGYYKTFNILLDRIDIDSNKITTLLNKIDYDDNYKFYCSKIGIKYYYELPYLREIEKNINNPFKKLEERIHNTEKFNRKFKALMRMLYKIEYEENLNEEDINIKIEQQSLKEIGYDKSVEIDNKLKQIQNNNKNQNKEIKNTKTKKSIFDIFKKDNKNTNKNNSNYYNDYIDEGGEF